MGIAVLLSASGSPGVTATALAIGLTLEAPSIVLEADAGRASDIQAGYFRGQVAAAERGLDGVSALASARRLDAMTIERELVAVNDTTSVVLGFSSPTAGGGAAPLWSQLAETLTDLSLQGRHIVIDAGRWTFDDPRVPLLAVADQVLLLTRQQLPAIASAVPLTKHLQALPQLPDAPDRIRVITRQSKPEGYDAATIGRSLGAPVLGSLSDDPLGAAIFTTGADPARANKRPFVKDVASIARELAGRFAARERTHADAARHQNGGLQ